MERKLVSYQPSAFIVQIWLLKRDTKGSDGRNVSGAQMGLLWDGVPVQHTSGRYFLKIFLEGKCCDQELISQLSSGIGKKFQTGVIDDLRDI